jgi:hypothetical protein
LFDRDELKKYMTAEELTGLPGGDAGQAAAAEETH